MPKILERCVLDLTNRGVGKSSAYAICTSSLQKAGKLPRSSEEKAKQYVDWSKRVQMPPVLSEGMGKAWETLPDAELGLLSAVKRVELIDYPGYMGAARLHSKTIQINPASLQRVGNHYLWHGAVAVHEAVHAVHGMGEHEATRTEQRYAGKMFGESFMDFDREGLYQSTRAAAVAQVQREKQVHFNHRMKDFAFLTGVGYTAKSARRVMDIGKRYSQASNTMRQGGKDLIELTPEFESMVFKTVDAEMDAFFEESIAKGGWGFEYRDVTPRSPESIVTDFLRPGQVPRNYESISPYQAVFARYIPESMESQMEGYVSESVRRAVGQEQRFHTGIVPALRRAGWKIDALSPEWQAKRIDALRELFPKLKVDGAFQADGSLTDTHLLCLLHGWTPVPGRVFGEE